MKEPRVTVLITVRNNAATIKQCIESVLRQSYKNYDAMVVDAYSDDGTYEILKSFDKKIKLYRVHGWAPKAYNFAIDRIKSEFVAFTDGDCVVDKSWLKELVSAFNSGNVLATAGYCGTSKNVTTLQRTIGMELENRFRNFPEFISRAPTMNLCVKTNILKKLKFDERFKVAFETDFGYRLNEIGKMRYNKNAKIYHYHRASWRDLFKQQKTYGEYTFLISMKYKRKMLGDHITNPYMLAQVPAFWLMIVSIFLSFFDKFFLNIIALLIFVIIFVFIIKIHKMKIKSKYIPMFLIFFSFRMIAWSLGLIRGVINYISYPRR